MSWSIFYLEMQAHMVKQTLAEFPSGKKAIKKFAAKTVVNKTLDSIIDLTAFATAFCDAYDKAVKTGKTLIGGVPVSSGNKKIMLSTLILLMKQSKNSGKKLDKTLLQICGKAVLAYWAGASLSKFPPPKIPCIGAVTNISTIKAIAIFPGVWTPIIVGPQNSFDPFLLSFIASAMLHSLTIAGFFQCNCQYPPPAPPAVGLLPWVGYFVAPPTLKGPMGVRSLVASTIKTKVLGIKNTANFYKGVAQFALKNGKYVLGAAALGGLGFLGVRNLQQNQKNKKRKEILEKRQKKLAELLAKQKEFKNNFSLQRDLTIGNEAQRIASEAFLNNAKISKSDVEIIDDSEIYERPKTDKQKIKDGDIKKKVDKIENTTKEDVKKINNFKKSMADVSKKETGNLTNIIPKSLPAENVEFIQNAFSDAYDKIMDSSLSNLEKIDLFDYITKITVTGGTITDVEALIKNKKEINKTEG